jgi:hypothetical protein
MCWNWLEIVRRQSFVRYQPHPSELFLWRNRHSLILLANKVRFNLLYTMKTTPYASYWCVSESGMNNSFVSFCLQHGSALLPFENESAGARLQETSITIHSRLHQFLLTETLPSDIRYLWWRCDCLGDVKQLRFYFLYTAFLRTDFLSGGGAIRHHISRNEYFTSHWICLIQSHVWNGSFEAAFERILAFPLCLTIPEVFRSI